MKWIGLACHRVGMGDPPTDVAEDGDDSEVEVCL